MTTRTTIMGMCPVCQHVVLVDYRDKLHRVGHCTGCGLVYGNEPLTGTRYNVHQKVITDLEIHRMLNEAYVLLSQHEPNLKAATLLTYMNKVAVRMTGYGVPDIPIWKFNRWGYDIVLGYIKRRDKGES